MTVASAYVGIVDYQAGNVHSIASAFDHLGARTSAIRDERDIDSFSHILLPGVGAFGYCAAQLARTGLAPALRQAVEAGKPLLGICVGMQLLADWGEELGGSEGLGWIGGAVRAMAPDPPKVRIPHVGWNEVTFTEPFGSFSLGERADFYFDHSFSYQEPGQGAVVGTCDHGPQFAAIVRRGALVGAQFHPEKSQATGLRFLKSFLDMAAC